MEAAIPMVTFNGILENQIEMGGSLEDLFARLNHSLCRILDQRKFVCCTMGELNLKTLEFKVSNAGCPYPYYFKVETGEQVELEMDAYPLGVSLDIDYPVTYVQLEPGDRVVLCSDGIIEANHVSGEQLGFDRVAQMIQKLCITGQSSDAIIDGIWDEVDGFRGEADQADDMTCVVVGIYVSV